VLEAGLVPAAGVEVSWAGVAVGCETVGGADVVEAAGASGEADGASEAQAAKGRARSRAESGRILIIDNSLDIFLIIRSGKNLGRLLEPQT
jgi:hypothetical protein